MMMNIKCLDLAKIRKSPVFSNIYEIKTEFRILNEELFILAKPKGSKYIVLSKTYSKEYVKLKDKKEKNSSEEILLKYIQTAMAIEGIVFNEVKKSFEIDTLSIIEGVIRFIRFTNILNFLYTL